MRCSSGSFERSPAAGIIAASALCVTFAAGAAHADDDLPVVGIGAPLIGVIGSDAAEVTSPGLEEPGLDLTAPARGVKVALALPETGPVTLTMRGVGIDGYLVVRDADGAVIAEDDDGWYWCHPRIVLTEPGAAHTVEAIAIEGGIGRFEVVATVGERARPGPDERRVMLEEDAERALAARGDGADVPEYVFSSLATRLMDLEAPRWPPALLDAVLALRVARYGEDDQRVGVALNDLGLAQSHAGDDRAARETLSRALDVLTRAVGPDHKNTLSTVGNLGTVERGLGDLASAEDRFAHVVVATERTHAEDSVELAFARLNLAVVRVDNGELEAARTPLVAAVEVLDDAFGPDHALTLEARAHLATLYDALGRHDLAGPLLEELLEVRRRTLGEENPKTAMVLNNLAVSLRNQDRLDEARDRYEQAIAIFERTVGRGHPSTLNALRNLGFVLIRQADYGRARRVLEEVVARQVEARGSDHPDVAMAKTTLAMVARGLGRYDEERRLLEEAAEVLERRLGPTHPDVLFTIAELAICIGNLGDDERAIGLQRRLVRARTERYGADHPQTLHAETNLAIGLSLMGEPGPAIGILERVVPAVEEKWGSDHAETLGSLTSLVTAYHLAGRHGDARAAALRALGGTGRRRLDQLAARTEAERLLAVRADASRLGWLLSQPVGQADLRAEHEAVLRWKGEVNRSLRRDREALLARVDAPTREDVDRLRALRRRLARVSDEHALGEDEVARLRHEVGALESSLLRRLEQDADAGDVGWRELQRAIPADAAFIDLLVFDRILPADPGARLEVSPSLMAYVFRPGTGKVSRRVIGRLDELEADVARIVGGMDRARGSPARLVEPTSRSDAADAVAGALYARLFEPYEDFLAGVDHVIVSPDRFLGALPYEVLRDREGRYLVERFRFSYVSDAGSLCEIVDREPSRIGPGDALAVGDVDHGEGGEWANLPGTARELSDFERRFEGAVILRGRDATAAALRAALPKARLAHLATHGFFREPAPRVAPDRATLAVVEPALLDDVPPGARTGLVLAAANDGDVGTILTADEVGWLDLSGLDLVVLSACETGLGQAVGGEGMQSLQRAFHVAGARTVVASLWKVDDDATVALMSEFYRGLVDEGRSPSEALRRAQLALLAVNRERFGDARPETWGAFVLSGDWR